MQEQFYDKIKQNKPDITEKSILAYVATIKPFYTNNSNSTKINKKFFLDTSKILELIKDKPNKTQTNILCSILAFIGAPIPEYTAKIFTLSEEYKEQIDKNVKIDNFHIWDFMEFMRFHIFHNFHIWDFMEYMEILSSAYSNYNSK